MKYPIIIAPNTIINSGYIVFDQEKWVCCQSLHSWECIREEVRVSQFDTPSGHFVSHLCEYRDFWTNAVKLPLYLLAADCRVIHGP